LEGAEVNSEGHGQNMIELSIGKYSESILDQQAVFFLELKLKLKAE